MSQQSDIAAWVTLYAQNIALGLLPIVLYGGLRSTIVGERQRVDSYLIGILFGLSSIASMSFPIHLSGGFSSDGRVVFVLVGSLFGGPIGTILATGIAAIYRYFIGGPGMTTGLIVIVLAGVIGFTVDRIRGGRSRDFGFFELVGVGLLNAFLGMLLIRLVFTLMGLPPFPFASLASGLVAFPLGTAILGMALSMTRNRVLWGLQQRINDIIETTSDLVWETDVNDRLTYVSERHRAILGYPREHYETHPASEFGVWVDEPTGRSHANAIARREPFKDLHALCPTASGGQVLLSISGRPKFDASGRYAGYRGTAADITERDRLDTELRRNLFRLERAQRIGRIGYIEVDLVTGKGIWSDEIYALFGLDPSVEPSLELYLSCNHPDDRETSRALYERNRKGFDLEPTEYRVLRPDGKTVWLRREIEVMRDEVGLPVRLFAIEQDITPRKQMELELAHLATIDPLTGVLNRRHFLELAERQLARVRRGREPSAIVMFDLDHFKSINDRYGHAAGDATLRHAAALCQSELRPEDIFGRIGGEEFAVILSGCDHATARHVAQRLRATVADAEIAAQGYAIRVTASFGISDLAPEDHAMSDGLGRADRALYEAKAAGRNRVMERWATPEERELMGR
jgi:diguanylate cyclase (GGDEF)-like protein/PAS domain S-box-containing protein